MLDLACDAATSDMGQFVSSLANGVDVYSIRESLGVCAGMCLPNFSALIALWMFPLAVVYGNTFILKSSLKDPGVCMMLAELASEAGLPNGVLNFIHGADLSSCMPCMFIQEHIRKGHVFRVTQKGGIMWLSCLMQIWIIP